MDPRDVLRRVPVWTPRHVASDVNNRAIDRACEMMAKLAVRLPDEPVVDVLRADSAALAARTGHTAVIEKLEEEKLRIDSMLAASRKERSAGFLKCARCKSTDVDVDQKQTRSADEPMTLFALCINCGTRWTIK